MKLRRKQKRVLSLVVTSAMLFSSMGMTAAAESIKRDSQPAITADAESRSTFDMNVEESEEETEKGTEEGTESESEKETESGTEGESDSETGEESEEGTEEESKEETEEGTEEGSVEESEEETEEGTEEGSVEESEEETEEGTEQGSAAETQEETREESEEGTREETEEGSVEETQEEIKDETSAAPEKTEVKPPAEPIPGVHHHSWSVDWVYDGTYHWHECEAEDCPAADDSEKDSYGEHSYDDKGVCVDCGYSAKNRIALAAQGNVPTYQKAYEDMISLKEKYPEGMTWTNFEPFGTKGSLGSAYTWKGGPIYGAKSAVGCMAFTFILSDKAFGTLPARAIENGQFTFEDVKVGDILRVNGNSHSVIVLQKTAGGVIVAEGNYNKTVHWGRAMSVAEVENADFIITRYPENHMPADDPEADKEVQKGTADGLSWSLTKGGVLTISGSGDMPNYSLDNSPWHQYDFYTIVIEDGVTSIGDYAFYQSKALSVYIPDSVEVIGQNAFGESSLVSVTIPETVGSIGNHAFYECPNLTSATVSEGVEIIGDEAFRGCTSLAYIDFPSSITSVGAGAFMSCSAMARVRFMPGSSNVTMGDNLFSQCWNLKSVTLPQTIESITKGMFQSCSALPELYIPASVQSIGESAFAQCPLGVIEFGGSEKEWEAMLNPQLRPTLQNIEIRYNVVFDDPFAADPDDPGDFLPDEDGDEDDEFCPGHVDADNDGKCDNCGKIMSTDNPEPDDGDSDDKTDPDDDEKDPDGSGGNDRPATDDSDDFGGSDDSSDGFEESSGSSRPPESGSSTVSTTVRWESDGSLVITKTQKDGSVVTTTTDAADKVKMEAKLSDQAVHTAQQNNKAVALPISSVRVVKDVAEATAITVHTAKEELVKVAIPTVLPTAGTVAVMVNGDGSTSVIKGSVPTEKGVVAFLPNGATIKIVDNSKSFSDVPAGAWFEEAVSFISARDLFYGTTETSFAPDAPMTYAAVTTALARFDGAQTDGGATWYEKSMEWAAVRGIRDGSGPDSRVTCEQLVTMLWKYQGSPVTVSDSAAAGQISDVQKAMDWAMKNNAANGFSNGVLDPQMQVSRGQAAQIIMNLFTTTTVNSVQ